MKITARIVLSTILLLSTVALFAQNNGPAANGDFVFSSGGNAQSFQFNARIKNNGSTDGTINYSGTVDFQEQDVDGEGTGPGSGLTVVSLTVDVDCLNISGNRASIGGVIEDSNVASLIGHRALLAIEDGGEGVNAAPDRFTWGLYGTPDLTWVPSDAELVFDPGVGLTWIATDFERDDDVGIPSNQSTEVTCQTFSFEAYSLENLPHGNGNLQVKP